MGGEVVIVAMVLGLPALMYQQRYTLLAVFGLILGCRIIGPSALSELILLFAPLLLALATVFFVGAVNRARGARGQD